MTTTRARIERAAQLLADDVVVEIQVKHPAYAQSSWQGRCTIDQADGVAAGEKLQFSLADGRSGSALVTGVAVDSRSQRAIVNFTGTGPLA